MTLQEVFAQITLRNIIDILLVAFLFYQIIAMMRGTRAAQVVIGLLVIFIAYALSSLLEFETIYWIISKFYASFIIVVIVLFQDDIRRLLTRFGRGPFVSGLEEGSGLGVIEEVVSAAKSLSHERLGAILVFERGIGLERLYDHAIRLDALVSEQLLHAIFQSFSPLHDGAVIIQKNRISCASAHLPLTKTPGTGKKLGTRHAAAVGISEQTDAVVLVVSEETGGISIAVNGELQRQQSPELAKRRLIQLLLPAGSRRTRMGWFSQSKAFYYFNILSLRLRMFFTSRPPYKGPERRSRSADRRLQHAYAWGGDHDAVRAVERENRLASNEVRMNLRFPGAVAQSRNYRSFGGSVVLTPRHESDDPHGRHDVSEEGASSEAASDLNDEQSSNMAPAPTALEQNEAAQAIIDLSPEDRLVPPEIPLMPPPRDVSIGGVSLNPPMESDKDPGSHHPESEPEGEPRLPKEGSKP